MDSSTLLRTLASFDFWDITPPPPSLAKAVLLVTFAEKQGWSEVALTWFVLR